MEPIITGQPPTGFISTKYSAKDEVNIDTIVIEAKYKWTPEEKIKNGWILQFTKPDTGVAQWRRSSRIWVTVRPPLKSTFKASGGGRIVQ